IDYWCGIVIARENRTRVRKTFLIISIITNIGLLFAFKYFNFVSDSIRIIAAMVSIKFSPPILKVLLPIGISFYTFQTLSYTIDVYRKKIQPEKHFGIYALYVSFFPQLVAGPIERGGHLLHQLRKKTTFKYERVTDGLRLILWGYIKKLVIADRLALIVDTVYSNVNEFSGITYIIATIFFAFQIYCDFSGYTDIARGCARVLGIDLARNFRRPYFAKSLGEFWQRWHISLSSWFRDYVYIPLGGSRVAPIIHYRNLLIVFLVSGMWHGANWTFAIWGLFHGCGLCMLHLMKNVRVFITRYLPNYTMPCVNIIKIFATFTFVTVGWVLFRAASLHDAWYMLTHFVPQGNITLFFESINEIHWFRFKSEFILLTLLIIVEGLDESFSLNESFLRSSVVVRWICYLIGIFMIILFGVYGQREFIYFQF
ncbi:MBOAT family O-acyltransferase, partial [Candidatus Omnitrophota bacterium]